MPSEVVLISIGMMTAVGLSAEETVASVRAGTARFAPSSIRDKRFQPFTAAFVPEDGLPPLVAQMENARLTARELRLLRLATGPLTKAAGVPRAPAKVPLFLSLPEGQTKIPVDGARFLEHLGRQAACVNAAQSRATFTGRAGGLAAIGAAVQAIAEGKMPFALAGGADSFLDLYTLGTLDMESRIKSTSNWDGFVPGEGAAFVLLASRTAADGIQAKPLAKISAAAAGNEPGHLYSPEVYRGEGLTQTLTQLFAAAPPPQPIAAVYSSLNGESHWGKEWSIAYMRNSKHFAPTHRLYHPADCYGDLGAAAGPALVALAAHGSAGGYRPHPALVYSSNDHAQRAALLVMAA